MTPTNAYLELARKMDPHKSHLRFDSTPYKGDEELLNLYKKGYSNGLDGAPTREVSLANLTPKGEEAYIHGFFTGDYEAWNDIHDLFTGNYEAWNDD